eukprot:UC1_evm1s788
MYSIIKHCNNLVDIEPGAFDGASVKEFSLFSNERYSVIKAGTFKGLTVSGNLNILQNTGISRIELGAISGAVMNVLRIEDTQIGVIGKGFFEGARLTGVRLLRNSNLTVIKTDAFDQVLSPKLSASLVLEGNPRLRQIERAAFRGICVCGETSSFQIKNNAALQVLDAFTFEGMQVTKILLVANAALNSIRARAFAGIANTVTE